MVWEFQLPTIVMLTELIERGIVSREGCILCIISSSINIDACIKVLVLLCSMYNRQCTCRKLAIGIINNKLDKLTSCAEQCSLYILNYTYIYMYMYINNYMYM